MARFEGKLTFDVNSGKFWITGEGDAPVTSLEFDDTFEVLTENGWVETALQIVTGPDGDLQFKLKNTNYQGILDDLEVRQ